MFKNLGLGALTVLFSIPAFAAVDVKYAPHYQCLDRISEAGKWEACVYEYPNSGHKVLYYFNGLNGDARTWKNSAFEQSIVKHWIDSGVQPPLVVSISFETPVSDKLVWFMVEKNSSPKSGKFEVVTEELMPLIRQKFFPNLKVEENMLMGVSMGAFNASQLYFKKPEMFSRAALICLPASTVTPFDDPSKMQQYIARTQADKSLVGFAMGVAADYMPTPADWKNDSPLSLAVHNLSPTSKPLYIADGTGDVFGFDEGDMVFTSVAEALGAPITSHYYANRPHCYIESQPLADFFTGVRTPMAKPADELPAIKPATPELLKELAR